MDFWAVIALAALTLVGWGYIWRTGRKHADEQSPPLGTDFPHSPRADVQDPFLLEVASERAKLDADIAKRSNQYERLLESTFGEDVQLRDRLTSFARENRLDRALLDVWVSFKSYPSSPARIPQTIWSNVSVSNVVRSDLNEGARVSFSFQGRTFHLDEKRWEGRPNRESYSDLELNEDDNLAFGARFERQYDESADKYIPVSVSAFRRGGTWAHMLLQIRAELEYERNKRLADLKFLGADSISDRFHDQSSTGSDA